MKRSENHRTIKYKERADQLYNNYIWPDDQAVFLDIARVTGIKINDIRELRWNDLAIRLGKFYIMEEEYVFNEKTSILIRRGLEEELSLTGEPIPEGSNPLLFTHGSAKEIHKILKQNK